MWIRKMLVVSLGGNFCSFKPLTDSDVLLRFLSGSLVRRWGEARLSHPAHTHTFELLRTRSEHRDM